MNIYALIDDINYDIGESILTNDFNLFTIGINKYFENNLHDHLNNNLHDKISKYNLLIRIINDLKCTNIKEIFYNQCPMLLYVIDNYRLFNIYINDILYDLKYVLISLFKNYNSKYDNNIIEIIKILINNGLNINDDIILFLNEYVKDNEDKYKNIINLIIALLNRYDSLQKILNNYYNTTIWKTICIIYTSEVTNIVHVKKSNDDYILKMNVDLKYFNNEVNILKKINLYNYSNNNTYFPKIYDSFIKYKGYILMKKINNSINIFDLNNESYELNNKLITIFKNFITAIKALHDINIVHLDLHNYNYLINKDTLDVSIIDFEFSIDLDNFKDSEYFHYDDDIYNKIFPISVNFPIKYKLNNYYKNFDMSRIYDNLICYMYKYKMSKNDHDYIMNSIDPNNIIKRELFFLYVKKYKKSSWLNNSSDKHYIFYNNIEI